MALPDSGSKINTMTLFYIVELVFIPQTINFGTQAIDDSTLKIYKIVIVSFLLQAKLSEIWYFKETFLLADIRMEIIFRILLFSLSNINFNLQKYKNWKIFVRSHWVNCIRDVLNWFNSIYHLSGT